MSIRKGSSIIAGNPTLDSVVTTNTAQTITGNKTFSGTVQVPTSSADVGTSTEAVNVKYLYDEGYSALRSNTANIDLSNLSNTGEAHFANPALTNSPYTTNRILEIPQDIKLELNNGTLTLKAGSRVYFPNGFEQDGTTPKFDTKTIQSDIMSDYGSGRTNCVIVIDENNQFQWAAYNEEGSGTTPTTEGIYYNTSTNTITSPYSWFSGKASLPIAVITENTGSGWGYGVKSIDQVFNGFGYIGSTVFALPNIKIQGAFGVNEDGTYKLKTFVTDRVLTASFDSSVYGRYEFGFDVLEDGTIPYFGSYSNEIKTGEKQPSGLNFAWWNPIKGETFYVNISGIAENTPYTSPRLGLVNVSGGRIDSMIQNQIDSLVTSNALNFSQVGKSLLSGLGMPSTKYEDWTLGAAGSQYIAPANGYLFFRKNATAANQYIYMSYTNVEAVQIYSGGASDLGCFIPLRKGQVVTVGYDAAGVLRAFRFFYAEGEN